MGFLAELRNYFKPDPLAPCVYQCDPLLIVDSEQNIVFHGQLAIECKPDKPDARSGTAVCLDPISDGSTPKITFTERYSILFNPDPHVRTRGGFCLVGEDKDGKPFTWYVDKYADDYFLASTQGKIPEFEMVDSLEEELP